MRILVAGKEGQLARALAALTGAEFDIATVGRPELDITDVRLVADVAWRFRPDVMVNAAAYTAVDLAESNEDLANAVNCLGAENVARVADGLGIPVIHVSTDYVFSGEKGSAYKEDDPPSPLGKYGLSKLRGEERVARVAPRHAILRTAWVYSPWGKNFAKTMLGLAGEREVVRVVADQAGTPTHAEDLADGILRVARRSRDEWDHSWTGSFHLTARGSTTWAGFAEAIFAASARRGGPSARVEPISASEYPTPAPRPRYSCLDIGHFERTFRCRLPDWPSGVERFAEAMSRPRAT